VFFRDEGSGIASLTIRATAGCAMHPAKKTFGVESEITSTSILRGQFREPEASGVVMDGVTPKKGARAAMMMLRRPADWCRREKSGVGPDRFEIITGRVVMGYGRSILHGGGSAFEGVAGISCEIAGALGTPASRQIRTTHQPRSVKDELEAVDQRTARAVASVRHYAGPCTC